ncbi:MAG: J domain-containing protein [Spirochaetia bacterium]|nr:J domain-containing protein [Spirochaetia bacterium]
MTDHYLVLGVSPDASDKDVKSAFRKKAKTGHPDVEGGDASRMRELLDAYRVLSDPQLRREYDRGRLRIIRDGSSEGFDYRAWLKERLGDPEYVAKLVFYDLLHNLEDEALELYETIRHRSDGRLERFFERPEAMDAEFCIAEEYAARGRFRDAFDVMAKLIRMEQRLSGFGYFYDVVLARFRKLTLEELGRTLEPEDEISLLEEASSLRSSAVNDAQFLRRAAELHLRLGRRNEAALCVSRAQALRPRLPGLKALVSRILSVGA